MDLRFVDQGRISQERLHVSGTVLLQKIDGKLAGITVRNGATLPGNIHIIPIIGKGPRISSGGKTESRRLRIVGARAQGKNGTVAKMEVGNVHHQGIGSLGQGNIQGRNIDPCPLGRIGQNHGSVLNGRAGAKFVKLHGEPARGGSAVLRKCIPGSKELGSL